MTYGGNNFSRTFQELKLQFAGLSRSWNLKKKNPGLFRRRGNPAMHLQCIQLITAETNKATLDLLSTI